MQTWPCWPSPPVVEVTALRAEFGEWRLFGASGGTDPADLVTIATRAEVRDMKQRIKTGQAALRALLKEKQ